jgi:hypothetical protein
MGATMKRNIEDLLHGNGNLIAEAQRAGKSLKEVCAYCRVVITGDADAPVVKDSICSGCRLRLWGKA